MSYYYTIREYASIKGVELSLQDEAAAIASATLLSNTHGVQINKTYCGHSERNMHCYASGILRETFKPIGKNLIRYKEQVLENTPV